MYLCENPKDDVSREYVLRVLELETVARAREDAETCATALRLIWTVEGEQAMSWELVKHGR